MKIAQVATLAERCPTRVYGGTERIVSYLTEELVRQGADAGAPGAQPGEAKEDASSPIAEDRTHADK